MHKKLKSVIATSLTTMMLLSVTSTMMPQKVKALGTHNVINTTNFTSNDAIESTFKWTRNLDFGADNFNSIAYNGKGLYVCVGADGIVKTSNDLVTWKAIKLDTNDSLFSVIWDGNQFMAVGGYSKFTEKLTSSDIFTSKDGQIWEKKTIDTTDLLYDVVYNGEKYVAVGTGSSIFTSNDGNKWDKCDSGIRGTLNGITWSGHKFVAVGVDYLDHGIILTSTDGISWSKQEPNIDNEIIKVTYGDNKFVAVGKMGVLLSSNDGVVWKKSEFKTTSNLINITWNNKSFVAISDDGKVLTSENGMDWQEVFNKAPYKTTDVIWDGHQFVFSGTYSRSYVLTVSKDPTTSKDVTTLIRKNEINSTQFSSVAYNGKVYIATGGYNLYNSLNGKDWKLVKGPIFTNIKDIIWTGEKFILVAERGGVYTSTDGENFEKLKSPGTVLSTSENLNGIAWNKKIFVAVGGVKSGDSACVITSTDGVNWTKATLPMPCFTLNSVTWNGSKFVAVGGKSEYGESRGRSVLTSVDGITWTGNSSSSDSSLNKITWNGQKFVAVGTEATVTTSLDGITWENKKFAIGKYTEMYTIISNDKQLVVGGDEGNILTSINGVNWTKQPHSTYNSIKSVIWDGNKYMAVGDNGTILTSNEASTPTNINVTGIQLNKKSLELEVGQSEKLVATVTPENATNKLLKWSSTNEDIAMVDNNGLVTVKKEGNAVIEVKTIDGDYSAKCTLTGIATNTQGNLEVTLLNPVKEFKLGSDAQATIRVKNNTKSAKQVTLIMALFDKENKFLSYETVTELIDITKTSDLTISFKLLNDSSYVKCLVWDSLEGMNPISKCIVIPVIK